MKDRLAYCNEGCNNQFLAQIKTAKLPGAIEKIYFICYHCNHEYVAFYTDIETRKLQEQMQLLHKRFADPAENKAKLIRQEKKLKTQIKRAMKKARVKAGG